MRLHFSLDGQSFRYSRYTGKEAFDSDDMTCMSLPSRYVKCRLTCYAPFFPRPSLVGICRIGHPT